MTSVPPHLPPYHVSLAGTLLAARESVMAPIRPILRAAGVTEQQWRVLRVLADEGRCDASRLSAAAILHPPSVTRILKELGDRMLIAREHDPEDGRRILVAITDPGRTLVANVGRRTRLLLDDYGVAFGTERLARLQHELIDLSRAIAGLASADEAANLLDQAIDRVGSTATAITQGKEI